jgi:hypothetical protein
MRKIKLVEDGEMVVVTTRNIKALLFQFEK